MPEDTQAVSPDTVQVDSSAFNDDFSTASALETLLFPEEPKEAPVENKPQESAPAEEPASGDEAPVSEGATEDSEAEQAKTEAPAIEAPVSWSAEDKDLFKQLPPKIQQTLLARESERDRGVNQRLQEAAEFKKAIEAEKESVARERGQYAQTIQTVLAQLVPELQAYQKVDWQALARDNPSEWAQHKQAYESLMARFQMGQMEIQRVQQQQAQESTAKQRGYLQDQKAKLIEKAPVFSDPAKGRELARQINDYLVERGFAPEEISGLADHRTLLVLKEVVEARQLKKAAETAAAKKVVPLQKVVKPGTQAAEDRGDKEARSAFERLRKTGSDRDAAALLERYL